MKESPEKRALPPVDDLWFDIENQRALPDPSLRECLVLYLDELGTGASAQESYTDDALARDLANYRSIHAYMKRELLSSRCAVKTFSDNILAVSEFAGFVDIIRFTYVARRIQSEGMMNGKFYRGGLSSGRIYIDDNHVAGPSLVRAVRLEEKTAIYPRIVIDPNLFLNFSGPIKVGADSSDPVYPEIVRDSRDDQIFVNYYMVRLPKGIYDWLGNPDPVKRRSVQWSWTRRRDVIRDALEAYSGNDCVSAKYEWLADYHDWAASRIELRNPDDFETEYYVRSYNEDAKAALRSRFSEVTFNSFETKKSDGF